MYCKYCGNEILNDSNFCPYCGKSIIEFKEESIDLDDSSINDYYKDKASKIASDGLIAVTTIICYIAFLIFLVFSFKMIPYEGWKKIVIYIISNLIAIGLIILFHKKILHQKQKTRYIVSLLISSLIIVLSISLRIVYESKIDYARTNIPSSGEILVSFSETTKYYNETGSGHIDNPSTSIKINNIWYQNGDIIPVKLNENYFILVKAGNYEGYSSINSNVKFNKSTLSKGRYGTIAEIYLSSGPATMAEVTLVFERYLTFWDVVLYE